MYLLTKAQAAKARKSSGLHDAALYLKLCLHLEVVMSHRRTLWSKLQLATKSPRSWNATPQTAWVWSVYVATQRCCSKLHSLTLASPDADVR